MVRSSFVLYRVELQNSVSTRNSTLRSLPLLEGFAGRVQNLQLVMVTHVSITVAWAAYEEAKSGYSIYINDSSSSPVSQ